MSNAANSISGQSATTETELLQQPGGQVMLGCRSLEKICPDSVFFGVDAHDGPSSKANVEEDVRVIFDEVSSKSAWISSRRSIWFPGEAPGISGFVSHTGTVRSLGFKQSS
jgi:hypothetical protein